VLYLYYLRDVTTRSTNIWNLEKLLKELDQKTSKFASIEVFHERFMQEIGLILSICDSLVHFNLSQFLNEILKSIINAPTTLAKYLSSNKAESIDSYFSQITLLIENLRLLKETSFQYTLQIGPDRKKKSVETSLTITEEEEGNSQDIGDVPKNEMVAEYNDSVDASAFCTRILNRFELRLFGIGMGDSIETEVLELISKAQSRERLSRMYEGWMPWI
jgi:phosphatidylinositol kinase/protein kinase (PI-3  family)